MVGSLKGSDRAGRGDTDRGFAALQLLDTSGKGFGSVRVQEEEPLVLAVELGNIRRAVVVGHSECRDLQRRRYAGNPVG